jgi:hypothetical protein
MTTQADDRPTRLRCSSAYQAPIGVVGRIACPVVTNQRAAEQSLLPDAL